MINEIYFFECDCGNFIMSCKTEELLDVEISNHHKYCGEKGTTTTHTPQNPNGILTQQEIDDLKEKIRIFKFYSMDD